ncbi:MAG: NAD(P)(+) transhydrogenase (Re/Si-specific) subunit beta [Gemmatimonadales bacterium]
MAALIKLVYLLAAVCFIVGLKRLSHPAKARSGNAIASVGMLLAIVVTLLDQEIVNFQYIIVGAIIGSAIGATFAKTVKMTGMPQMVALLNGFGGGASALVAGAEFVQFLRAGTHPQIDVGLTTQLSVLVGCVTFSGSLIAFGKLQELVTGRAVTYPLQKTLNALLFAALVALIALLVVSPGRSDAFITLVVLSLLLGVLSVIPIGGADMPVVISLLNSYSGIAAALTGFVIGNNGLIIGGALVGASGIILTNIMCRAMNRSLANVLFGAFGSGAGAVALGPGGGAEDRPIRQITAEDGAMMMAYAKLVVVVPGYGLAVAQAQHEVRELAELLQKKGVDVKYAIHPVAGRMPGHMNVLLAEANVPYDELYDMDQINPEFDRTDVSLVIGANDVVNPAARNTPESPLYGMPILNVDKSHQIIVLKRSMRPGFAGVGNELFYDSKTSMLFGDAKDSIKKLVAEVKEV